MARTYLLIALCLTLAGVHVSGAIAITNGEADGERHPYGGALVVDGQPACSATLVSPTVVVTAGHCVAGLASPRVAVSFDAQLDPASWTLVPGTAHLDPRFGTSKTDTHDLAVVVLDRAAGLPHASLPAVDAAIGATSTVAVGYGYHDRAQGEFVFDGLRRMGTIGVKKVGSSTLTLSSRDGGVCFGDSGGPHLLGDTVVALTSTGTRSCNAAEAYRLDTLSARAFLGRFVALP